MALASPYFEALLFGAFKESAQRDVELRDTDAAQFELLLYSMHGVDGVVNGTVVRLL